MVQSIPCQTSYANKEVVDCYPDCYHFCSGSLGYLPSLSKTRG